MAKNQPIPKVSVSQDGPVTTIISTNSLRLLVMSDVHFDSPFCYREQFFADLDYAKETGALVVIVGDFFDAMQGRFDPRRDMESLRPEYRRSDYYDFIVEDAINWLKPYRRSILLVTPGNHELAVLKNANTDLMTRFTKGLSIPTHEVLTGGYGGTILVHAFGGYVPIKYFHGSGGEAPVTKGVIQTARQAAYLADYKVVLNGHNHNMYYVPIARERVTNDGTHYFDLQHHVRTPGYAMPYADGTGGWEVTRGGVPKPVGSVFLDIAGDNVNVIPNIHAPIPVKAPVNLYSGPVFNDDSEGV